MQRAAARKLVALFVIGTGCGRIGFDPAGDGGDDADPGARCAAQKLSLDLAASAPARGVVAAGLGGGRVAFGVVDSIGVLMGARLDAALVPEGALMKTSPLGDGSLDYRRVTMQYDGANLVGAVYTALPELYLKHFPEDMSLYLSADLRPSGFADPMYATIGATEYAVGFEGSMLQVFRVVNGQSDGSLSGFNGPFAYDQLSVGGLADRFTIVARSTTGTCFEIDGDEGLTTLRSNPFGACNTPFVASSPTESRVVYELAGTIFAVPFTPVAVAPRVNIGIDRPVGTGTDPRAVRTREGFRYVWRTGSSFGIAAEVGADFATAAPTGLPSGAPDAWTSTEVAGVGRVFAVYGTEVWTFPLCGP